MVTDRIADNAPLPATDLSHSIAAMPVMHDAGAAYPSAHGSGNPAGPTHGTGHVGAVERARSSAETGSAHGNGSGKPAGGGGGGGMLSKMASLLKGSKLPRVVAGSAFFPKPNDATPSPAAAAAAKPPADDDDGIVRGGSEVRFGGQGSEARGQADGREGGREEEERSMRMQPCAGKSAGGQRAPACLVEQGTAQASTTGCGHQPAIP